MLFDTPLGGGGTSLYVSYIGMCDTKGHGF